MNKLKMTNNYSVYIHTNKTNGKKYVGITKQKPERRWQKGFGYVGSVFGVAINKYGWDGFTHDIVACELSKNEACKLEISLINIKQEIIDMVIMYLKVEISRTILSLYMV